MNEYMKVLVCASWETPPGWQLTSTAGCSLEWWKCLQLYCSLWHSWWEESSLCFLPGSGTTCKVVRSGLKSNIRNVTWMARQLHNDWHVPDEHAVTDTVSLQLDIKCPDVRNHFNYSWIYKALTLTSSAVVSARDMSAEIEHGTKAPSEKDITCTSASVLAKTFGRQKESTTSGEGLSH